MANQRCDSGTVSAPERPVEGRLHRVLEGAGVLGGKRDAVAVAPLVHVEPVDVVAGDAPLLEEVDRPAVHSHRSDRQDQGDGAALLARPADRLGDLVAELDVEVGQRLRTDDRRNPGATRAVARGSPRAGGRSRRRSWRGPSPGEESPPSSSRRRSSAGSWRRSSCRGLPLSRPGGCRG